MQITEEMVSAAMKKAVEVGLIPRYANGEDEYLRYWEGIHKILESALEALSEANE
jgi:hypothetical protein